MSQRHARLLLYPGLHLAVKPVHAGGTTLFVYDDKLSGQQRRALAGRPAGTECGNSCTCS